jgi:hypothetical protein
LISFQAPVVPSSTESSVRKGSVETKFVIRVKLCLDPSKLLEAGRVSTIDLCKLLTADGIVDVGVSNLSVATGYLQSLSELTGCGKLCSVVSCPEDEGGQHVMLVAFLWCNGIEVIRECTHALATVRLEDEGGSVVGFDCHKIGKDVVAFAHRCRIPASDGIDVTCPVLTWNADSIVTTEISDVEKLVPADLRNNLLANGLDGTIGVDILGSSSVVTLVDELQYEKRL